MKGSNKRILLIGASGIIGRAVDDALRGTHEVIRAGLDDADVIVDLSDASSIRPALERLGRLDAVISAAGRASFFHMDQAEALPLDQSLYGLGIRDKLMGQVNLVLAARAVLADGGSMTLTSGTTSMEPIIGGSSLSMVNGALEHWVRAAATELPRGLRLNVVSPGIVAESPPAAHRAFPGFEPVSAAKVAQAYVRSVESLLTGATIVVA